MDRWLGALKIFVVVAGILIVAGTGFLVWYATYGASLAASGGAAAGVTADLPLPRGEIVEIALDAGTALLRLREPGGEEYLVAVELATGRATTVLRRVPTGP